MSHQSNSTILVRVRPNSGESRVGETINSRLLVRLKSAPDKGKANMELIKLLSKHFRKKAEIISGFTSRDKVLRIY